MLNFKKVFPDICCKTSLTALENYPTPNDILDPDSEKLILIIQKTSKTEPSISENIKLLQSIHGIGFLSAATIIFVAKKNKMSKHGSKILRRILSTIALANIRTKRDSKPCNPVVFEYYQKKCQQKPKKVALGAVMKKLVAILFAVMRNKKPFEFRTPEEHIQRCFNKAAVFCI